MDQILLWSDGNVYYNLDRTINSALQNAIQQAMDTLQSLTCIRFIPHTNGVRDYITFRSRKDDGCSSHIGLVGREQFIQIGPKCNSQHTILHEICHALGLWHEQSRPDRDDYINVLNKNIMSGQEYNFMKRNFELFDVDSQGSYDYSSIMHYRLNAFSEEQESLNTLEISDRLEYERQGSPDVGRGRTLSKLDATQLNKLYNCTAKISGVPGKLSVNIQYALKKTSGRRHDLKKKGKYYVKVTAYDGHGTSETKITPTIRGDTPIWNTPLHFGGSKRNYWKHISVSIFNDGKKKGKNTPIIEPKTFPVTAGESDLEYCLSVKCKTSIIFSVSLTEICHCLNGGSCLPDKTCACPTGFGGARCEHRREKFEIAKIELNSNQLNKRSKIFFVVQAYDHNGATIEKRTTVIDPTTNMRLRINFGFNEWSWFTLQAWKQDHPRLSATRLTYAHTYVLDSSQPTTKLGKQSILEGGSINFAYTF